MQARFPGATSRRNRFLCQSCGSEWPVLGVGGTSFASDLIALAVRIPRASRDMLASRRSTKGASKARRDHINSEIRCMRALLPIPLEDQERLSYLHSMSAICTFIRKSVFFQGTLILPQAVSLWPECHPWAQLILPVLVFIRAAV